MQYKLFVNAIATTNAAASLKIVKSSKLKAICFALLGISGAGVTGYQTVEISKQNTNSCLVNDAPPTVLGYAQLDMKIASAANAVNVVIPCDASLETGDTIYLNIVQGGTAPSSTAHCITLIA